MFILMGCHEEMEMNHQTIWLGCFTALNENIFLFRSRRQSSFVLAQHYNGTAAQFGKLFFAEAFQQFGQFYFVVARVGCKLQAEPLQIALLCNTFF
jgi:hypothetical protein